MIFIFEGTTATYQLEYILGNSNNINKEPCLVTGNNKDNYALLDIMYETGYNTDINYCKEQWEKESPQVFEENLKNEYTI